MIRRYMAMDKIGWNLIGFDDQAYWAPPFGYYDAHPEEKA